MDSSNYFHYRNGQATKRQCLDKPSSSTAALRSTTSTRHEKTSFESFYNDSPSENPFSADAPAQSVPAQYSYPVPIVPHQLTDFSGILSNSRPQVCNTLASYIFDSTTMNNPVPGSLYGMQPLGHWSPLELVEPISPVPPNVGSECQATFYNNAIDPDRVEHNTSSSITFALAQPPWHWSPLEPVQPILPVPSNVSSECQVTFYNNAIDPARVEHDTISPISLEQPRQSANLIQDLLSATPEINTIPSQEPSRVKLEPESIVCFGMVPFISARCKSQVSWSSLPSAFPVLLEASTSFVVQGRPDIHGQILSAHSQMIQGLLDEKTLVLHGTCNLTELCKKKKASKSMALLDSNLELTVYGPLDIFEEIGPWFEDYDVYLQDPKELHLEVPYCNPQRLSSDDVNSCPLVSEVVSQLSKSLNLQEITEKPELLDVLSSHMDLMETPQPSMIRGSLRRHQKQALTFMLRRERGWDFCNQSPRDMWVILDNEQGRFFFNGISGHHQADEPPQFYGGVIADPMGLGKTLTMIALVATDLDQHECISPPIETEPKKPVVLATLIVVPPPLLGIWEEQLSEHVQGGSLKCCRHHGKAKLSDITELENVNIILTTYHTIAAEWDSGRGTENSILFSVRYKRIILDEAHFIRNGNSKMAQAICSLDAIARWAVTGTPIQNRLGDLATLLRFIRAYPYTDPKCFDTDILRPWKLGEDEEAVKRLKRLSACLLLRRPKSTINLPPRRDMQCPVEFNHEERDLYDAIREKTIVSIEEALQNGSQQSRAGVYVNVLQQIESLRLVCNLGLHYRARENEVSQPSQEVNQWVHIAQQTFNLQREMGPVCCLQCSSVLELTESLLDDPTTTTTGQNMPQFSRCLRFICSECRQKTTRKSRPATCGHKPPCPMASVSTSSNDIESSPCLIHPLPEMQSVHLSSKVEALISDIRSQPQSVKCVVFSTWRLTLDLIEAGLEQASLRSTRFDGKVPQKERQNVVNQFKTDPTIRIMLLTLSCGAVGLTLTVATRAYLMEPHWNPTLEEQALARIHRIGQTKEVTTVRFYVRNSFEQQVMELQESKKHLAGLLLSPHDGGQEDESLGGLQRLRSLL